MATYDYEPLTDTHRKYCQAPRHGATHVQAKFLEKYESPELNIPYTESLSCQECHDSMLQAFMDESLPDPTEEEREQAIVDGLAMG